MGIKKIDEFNTIYQIDTFENELMTLFGKSKTDWKKFRTKFISMLFMLDRMNSPPTNNPFEKLKGTKLPLYRMKYKDRDNNIRVIYYWDDSEHKILLAALKEKDPSDYKEAIQLSIKRIKSLNIYKEETE